MTTRIEMISIKNFKNVGFGTLSLENNRKNYSASVVGVYGQNGSGKTALIDAIQLLKYAFCGQQIPEKFGDYVNVDASFSELEYQLKMNHDGTEISIWYSFKLRKAADDSNVNMDESSSVMKFRTEIFDEIIQYSLVSPMEKVRKEILVDTSTNDVFLPKKKYKQLLGKDESKETDYLVKKKLALATSRSFIFSREMINAFRLNCKNQTYMTIINGLMMYGNRELFIINTESSGLIRLNALPLAFKYKDGNTETTGNIMIPLNAPAVIPDKTVALIHKILDNMNIVLEQIVPGLTITIKDLGSAIFSDGNPGRSIQLMSLKNGKEIPLQYESEGIKKIVSILQLLIAVYNIGSITVAVDELDAGIFEYLLGELLHIISEKGKGQLIFTSHNLRPLETIDKGFIAFTTTNPLNRYIRLTNVKVNNNLRDFYFRDIELGEQKEIVYNTTNNYEIALAFREAGEAFGS